MSMYKMQNVFIPLKPHSQGKIKRGTRSAERGTTLLRKSYANKEKLY